MTYRIYVLTPQENGRVEKLRQFPDDAAAIKYAQELLLDGYAAEVWNGKDLVARIGHEIAIDFGNPSAVPGRTN